MTCDAGEARIRAGEARIRAGEKRSGGGWVSGARAARDLRLGGRERGEAVEVGGRGRRWWATGHGGSGCLPGGWEREERENLS